MKEKLTKAQKRRFFDKFGASAEKPRGWDWVSIISHVTATFPLFLLFFLLSLMHTFKSLNEK